MSLFKAEQKPTGLPFEPRVKPGRSPEHMIESWGMRLQGLLDADLNPKTARSLIAQAREKIKGFEIEIARREKANLGFKSVAALTGLAFPK